MSLKSKFQIQISNVFQMSLFLEVLFQPKTTDISHLWGKHIQIAKRGKVLSNKVF